MFLLRTCLLLFVVTLFGCAHKSSTFRQKDINKSFVPLLAFMGVKPGVSLADVGAGSGAPSIAMSSLMDSSVIYIQDIDSVHLRKEKVEKLLDQYSIALEKDLRKHNNYQIVIGDRLHTRLPDRSLDFIYTNATMHVFDQPDSILTDMGKKLKPDGLLFIRDSFKSDLALSNYCSDRTCAKPLYSIPAFLALMEKNRFRLVKQSPSMSGYPVFGFDYLD